MSRRSRSRTRRVEQRARRRTEGREHHGGPARMVIPEQIRELGKTENDQQQEDE